LRQRENIKGIPVKTLPRMAGGRSFHIEGPITAKVRCWAKSVLFRGTEWARRSADPRGKERQKVAFRIRSQR